MRVRELISNLELVLDKRIFISVDGKLKEIDSFDVVRITEKHNSVDRFHSHAPKFEESDELGSFEGVVLS